MPDDPPPGGGIWVGPDIALSPEAIDDLIATTTGRPIYGPTERPTQRPITVSSLAEMLARVRLDNPPYPPHQIALERADALDALGLGSDDAAYLRKRLGAMSQTDRSDLAGALFVSARATLDWLTVSTEREQRPTALWTPEGGNRARLVGQTLFWADHYLVADSSLEALLRRPEPEQLPDLAEPLAEEMRLRPLLEAGVLLLVPEQVAHVLVAESAYESAAEALEDVQLIDWLVSQVQVAGPTDREVIFVAVRDEDADHDQMFFHARIEGTEDRGDSFHFTTSMLGHAYDPNYDYGPWINQAKQQVAAQRMQQLEFALATSEVLGARYLATTPFQGRLLARRGRPTEPPSALAWVDVPSLPQADAGTLARIAREDETVEALRRTVRRTMAAASSKAPRAAAQELAEELREDAELLARTIRRDKRWKLVGPAGLGAVGLGLGALSGPLGVAAAGLGVAASLTPYLADRGAHKANPAYAVLLARGLGSPRR